MHALQLLSTITLAVYVKNAKNQYFWHLTLDKFFCRGREDGDFWYFICNSVFKTFINFQLYTNYFKLSIFFLSILTGLVTIVLINNGGVIYWINIIAILINRGKGLNVVLLIYTSTYAFYLFNYLFIYFYNEINSFVIVLFSTQCMEGVWILLGYEYDFSNF